MAVAALVVSAVAIAVVFATQSLDGAAVDAAVDDLSEGPAVTGVSPADSTGDAAAGAASGAPSDAPGASSADLAVGSAVEPLRAACPSRSTASRRAWSTTTAPR